MSPAFCLLFGLCLYGWGVGLLTGALLLASLLLHEVGHMLVATVLGVPVREFGLCFAGAYNRRARTNSCRDEILISAAGPMMNILLAFPLQFLPRIGVQVALCNLLLGLMSLVPMPSSDGLRIWQTAMRWRRAGAARLPALAPVLLLPGVRPAHSRVEAFPQAGCARAETGNS